MIQERVRTGLARAKMRAHSLGGKAETAVRVALARGYLRAKADGPGVGTVHRIKRDRSARPS
jgi:hypothetical protein